MKSIAATIILFIATMPLGLAQTKEYAVKAAYIEKFIRFTDFSKNKNQKHLVVVYGDNPFKGLLEKVLNEGFEVKYINQNSELFKTEPHLIFVTDNKAKEMEAVADYFMHAQTIVLGNQPSQTRKGAHLTFYVTENNTIHFEANINNLKKSGIKVDLLLLDIAKVVR